LIYGYKKNTKLLTKKLNFLAPKPWPLSFQMKHKQSILLQKKLKQQDNKDLQNLIRRTMYEKDYKA
jgi:hypothetical protein